MTGWHARTREGVNQHIPGFLTRSRAALFLVPFGRAPFWIEVRIVPRSLSQNCFCSRTTKNQTFCRSMMRLRLALMTYVLSSNGHRSANYGSPEQFRTLHEEGRPQCQNCSYSNTVQGNRRFYPAPRVIDTRPYHLMARMFDGPYFRGFSKGRATARRSSLCIFSPDFIDTA